MDYASWGGVPEPEIYDYVICEWSLTLRDMILTVVKVRSHKPSNKLSIYNALDRQNLFEYGSSITSEKIFLIDAFL